MLEGYVVVSFRYSKPCNPATCETFVAVQKTDATDSFLKLLQLPGDYQERFALEVMGEMVVHFHWENAIKY